MSEDASLSTSNDSTTFIMRLTLLAISIIIILLVSAISMKLAIGLSSGVIIFFIESTDRDLQSWIRDDVLKSQKEAAQGSLNALLKMNYPENLNDLSIPIKVLNARSFRETMLDENLASYENLEIEFFDDVGHFIMMEKPSEFNQWLELKIFSK